jgi:hypothetical protein
MESYLIEGDRYKKDSIQHMDIVAVSRYFRNTSITYTSTHHP